MDKFSELSTGQKFAVAALTAVILVATIIYWNNTSGSSGKASMVIDSDPEPQTSGLVPNEASPDAELKPMMYVHVFGEVKAPGVYSFVDGDRVQDAVDAAGGLTGQAYLASVNLAEPLADGAKVTIPEKGETVVDGSAQDSSRTVQSPVAASGGLVDLNRANAEELSTLPGIGPSMADRILKHRDSIGGFDSVEQLGDVSGIGDKRLAELRELCKV